jgi:predicted peptidase
MRRPITGILVSLSAVAALGVGQGVQAEKPSDRTAIVNVVPITEVLAFGQTVTAVAVEYSAPVTPSTLDLDTFTVRDAAYNFRYTSVEELDTIVDRTIVDVYTNDEPALADDGESEHGNWVIIDLDEHDFAGSTIRLSACQGFLCYVKVADVGELRTEVIQNDDVFAQPGRGQGRGRVLAAGSSDVHVPTQPAVDLLVDDFEHDTFFRSGRVTPYAYHIPDGYDPAVEYPMVVILPGHGMGYDGQNIGVQIAADIPATAWQQPEWTGTDEDVIVLAPQNPRVGAATEAADLVALINQFSTEFSVDQDRIYASTVSYGSTLAWAALANSPGVFDAALITGGFPVSAAQSELIAASGVPIWVTHGTNDHLLPVARSHDAFDVLVQEYLDAGYTESEVAELLHWTEYGNEAFSEPDYHLAAAPTYEDESILQWLLAQGG